MSHNVENDRIAQVIRDHRLQPRIRSGDAAPAEDYECLCGEMFWGVAEWSQHVATRPIPPDVGSGYCPDACTWPHDHRFERDGIPWPARTRPIPPAKGSGR